MMDLSKYSLILFDIDKTLVPFDSTDLLPGVAEWFADNLSEYYISFISNQGGVGLRLWMEDGEFGEPEKYPTEDDVLNRIATILDNLGTDSLTTPVYLCYAYQSKKGHWSPVPDGCEEDDEWSPKFRKPQPGMLKKAMQYAAGRYVSPSKTLMVGDSAEDKDAAINAGCDFMWADAFFQRDDLPF